MRCPTKAASLARSPLGPRRHEQGCHVAAQVRDTAGAKQHYIDARLVPRVTIGGLDQVGGASIMNKKAERIVGHGERRVD